MTELYPLKFEPILKPKVWGGNSLAKEYGKNYSGAEPLGESWELSGLQGDESIVTNGFLEGNNLNELIEVYMGDLTGDTIYDKYGNEFPLLIKLIDTMQVLSVQVHPDDDMAREEHHAYGKTEMWYILEAEPGAKIMCGFREGIGPEQFRKALQNQDIPSILNHENVVAGDAFFIPAGMIHAIGPGILLAEIQQSSDITYRIFDWDRGNNGSTRRELHIDLAMKALKYNINNARLTTPVHGKNIFHPLVAAKYFNTNLLSFDSPVIKDYNHLDSFVILLCTSGQFTIKWPGESEKINKGETTLIPATMGNILLEPEPEASLLEIYIKHNE